jgi:hypothetical protein
MKVSTENDNNFGYEKITILVDNIPLSKVRRYQIDNQKLQIEGHTIQWPKVRRYQIDNQKL